MSKKKKIWAVAVVSVISVLVPFASLFDSLVFFCKDVVKSYSQLIEVIKDTFSS